MSTQNIKKKKINNNLSNQKSTKPFRDLVRTQSKESKVKIPDHNLAEKRLGKLNECLLSFVDNPDENINRLVATCGGELGATCALYNRLKDGMLYSVGQWNTPPDYIPVDKPNGHICYDLIQSGRNEVRVIRNLPETTYAQTDPNVKCYGLKTYVGKTVFFGVTCVGSLCVVYQEDYVPSEDDKKFLGIIASAIGVEEKRKRAEEILKRSEETAKRMAQENAVMAGIGRIISSTLNIEEVYERFAEEVKKLIPFDRIVINTINIEKGTVINVYMAGKGVADRKVGNIYPLKGSGNAEMVRTKSSLLIQTEDFNEFKDRFPMLLSTFQAGFRSIMNVPLFSKGQIVGGLLLRSLKPYAYTEKDVRLVERIGDEIAGAIANAQLFIDHKQTEEALRESESRLRIILESIPTGILIIDPVTHVIVDVNPTATMLIGAPKEEIVNSICHKYICPAEIGRCPITDLKQKVDNAERILLTVNGETRPIIKTVVTIMLGGHKYLLESFIDITERKQAEEALRQSEEKYRTILENIEDGYFEVDTAGNFTFFNDSLCRALGYSKEEMMGMNNRQYMDKETAKKIYQMFNRVYTTGEPYKAYDWEIIRKDGTKRINESSVSLMRNAKGERIGFRGVSRDITERKQAEEALRSSEEEAKRLVQENATVAEIGRIISSSLNIDEGYERFAEEVRKLIPFDRIAIRTINPKDNTTTTAYISGVDVPGRQLGSTVPLFGTVIEECIRTQSSLLFQPESMDEVVTRFPHLLPTFKAGLRSMIFVPLISKDQVIGVLSLQATEPKAHTEGDLRLAERVGYQIAGAIANAQLFSEHNRTEEALRESERKFRDLYDKAPLGYHEYNLEGIITNVNHTDLEMLGYTAEEMIGQPIWKLNVNEETVREQVMAKLAGTLPPGKELERIYRRKDGTTFPVLIEDRLILDEKGRIKGIRCTIQDITERKRAEEEVLRQSAILEGMNKILRETLMSQTDEEVAQVCLSVAEELTGSKFGFIGELNKAGCFNTIALSDPGWDSCRMPKSDAAVMIRDMEIRGIWGRVIKNERSLIVNDPASHHDRVGTPEGHPPLTSFLGVPMKQAGRTIGMIALANKESGYNLADQQSVETLSTASVEALNRKRAEEALRKSEEKFQKLFNEAPVGYMELNIQGCITQVNRTELAMLGYTAEEMLGQPLWKFVVEEEVSRQTVTAKLSGSMQEPWEAIERTYKRKGGTTLTVLIKDTLTRDLEGKAIGIRSTIQDITELKRIEKEMASLEAQLRQSQKIEAIGRLAGGIAHDFNNLLTVIKGYSQLLLIEIKEGDPLRGSLDEIKKAADRAANLTHQVLAFSRRQILEMRVLDLNSLLRDLDKMFHRLIGEDIELVYLLSDDLGKVKTDPGQIEQVILNLAVNARDAMPSGGKLTIETANVVLDEAYARGHVGVNPGLYVMLSVSDTGYGMSPEVKEHLFEPFFTTKEKGKGTGLGLSTVYGIVKQSEGEIWVYSEPGQGTTFKIYLPRVDEAPKEWKEKAIGKEFPLGSETILVVEDELQVRGLAVRVLQGQGYMVLEASNGEEALRVVQEHAGENIHLLLTDVVMPHMGGKELADQLKILHPDIKVLYTSGYTDNAIVNHGILEPGTNFLQKPFSPEALAQKVREVLDR
jgi:two-component system cell cycle sensor histidine kinase/response regulator CckA